MPSVLHYLLAILVFFGLPSTGAAQTGQITGNLEGAALNFEVSNGVGGMPGVFFDPYDDPDYSGVSVIFSALEDSGEAISGVMAFVDFETEGALDLGEMTSENVADAVVMIVDEWQSGAVNPNTIWMAEADRFESLEITRLELSGDTGAIAGRIASQRFCLHDMSGGDPVAIRRDGAMICKPGAVDFAVASDGATVAPPRQPIAYEVLGRITGTVGLESHEWITILPEGGEATATLQPSGTGLDILRLQGHSPTSADFLRADVLSITVVGDVATGSVPSEGTVPVELAFFPGEPGVLYTSQEGEGGVTASMRQLYLEGDRGEAAMYLDGRICRVEDFEPVPGDCRSFEAEVRTEVIRARTD